MEVVPFNNISSYLNGNIGKYLADYLAELQASTVVIEENYVDRNFLIDYAKFYARSFSAPERFTRRLHFFSKKFSELHLKNALEGNKSLKELSESYLGFVVIKPIKDNDIDGSFLIGRTALKTYPKTDDQDTRTFLTHPCEASLYGIPFKINSLPFQTQDKAVAACATTALWVSLYPLSILFQVPMLSPSEITEKAVTFPGEQRNFPSLGLNLLQMVNFINFIGLDTENINVPSIDTTIVPDAVKAYISAKIPVIACLRLIRKDGLEDYHAVVISGYKSDINGNVKELYIHDDQIGPYSRVRSQDSFKNWINEWVIDYNYQKVIVKRLLVPIYPKIRVTFGRIYSVYLEYQERAFGQGFYCKFFLTQVNHYKRSLLDYKLENKIDILSRPLPRFIWVIRIFSEYKPIVDVVFDGTEVFPKDLLTVGFSM